MGALDIAAADSLTLSPHNGRSTVDLLPLILFLMSQSGSTECSFNIQAIEVVALDSVWTIKLFLCNITLLAWMFTLQMVL